MIVRLGYVSISKALDNVTPSSTVTYTNFKNEGFPVEKLTNKIKNNLESLRKIMYYNIKNNIHFYRITSNLIPLATHKEVSYDYINPNLTAFNKVAELINKYNVRVDMHPDQYVVLNSTKKNVVEQSINILKYHYKVLDALKIKNPLLILHVGSCEFGKKASLTRFINNFNKLPYCIRKCVAIENDDKIFNIKDVLELCKKLNVPMVLDYHHFVCNNEGEKIEDYLPCIFKTWYNNVPKVHFSSPKSKLKKDFRAHHEYINEDDFINFTLELKKVNFDVDVMIEAKGKDDALFRLVRQLKYKTDYKFIDETTFSI